MLGGHDLDEFIEAAVAMGASRRRIVFKHLIPNALGPIIVYTSLTVPQVMLLEAFISFLGLGVQPPTASWGNIIAEGKNYLSSSWWVPTLPGIAIVFTVLSFNLFGDSLHHYIDPRSTRR